MLDDDLGTAPVSPNQFVHKALDAHLQTSLSQLQAFTLLTLNVSLSLHRVQHCFSSSFRRNLCNPSEMSALPFALLRVHIPLFLLHVPLAVFCNLIQQHLLLHLCSLDHLRTFLGQVRPLQQFSIANFTLILIIVSKLCASSNQLQAYPVHPPVSSNLFTP